jgi:PTH1 family peptidyl-tRNA hydrolase
MKLVVGLGNPGREYIGTRHNVGYEVVERLAAKHGPVQFRRRFDGRLGSLDIARHKVLLLMPGTYMNESGRSVQAALKFYDLACQELLVVCDDLNLPAGKIRVRGQGSDGGQKGLRSIARAIGSTEFPRLRIGIGRNPDDQDASQYVLDRFAREQRELIDAAIDRAADAVLVWCEYGLEASMNQFN